MAQTSDQISATILDVDDSAFPDVRAIVTVVEQGGRPVVDLAANTFVAQETNANAGVIKVESVLNQQIGLGVVLALDTSGSMFGTPISQSRAAASAFVRDLQETDQTAVVSFASGVTVQDGFTTNRTSALAALGRLEARGDTSLYDALIESVNLARGAPLPRKAVVLLSDGVNVGGSATRDRALAAVTEARVPVYLIGLGGTIDRGFLEDVARATGGAFLETPDSSGIGALYEQISSLLRSQYVLTLRSLASADTENRSLRLTVRTPRGQAQAQLNYKTRRTIVPTPVPATSPTELPAPAPVGGRGNAGYIFVIVALIAALGTLYSMRYMFARARDRRVLAGIAVQSERATGELQAQAASADSSASAAAEVTERDVFLVVQRPGEERRFRVAKEPATIGTSTQSQLRLDDSEGMVAEEHARVWSRDGKLMFHQLARGAASLVGGKPVSWVSLENGDEIEIGDYRLRVEMS